MAKVLCAQVDALVLSRIDSLGGNPSVEEVITALKRKNFKTGQVPDGIPLTALTAFRKRSDPKKALIVQKVLASRAQGVLPNVEPPAEPVAPAPASPPVTEAVLETVPATVSAESLRDAPAEAEIQPVPGEKGLARLVRGSDFELAQDDVGEIYVSLRCVAGLIFKDADNLRRTMEARGFEIKDLVMLNKRGQQRRTPAIQSDHVFAAIMAADFHGLNVEQKEKLSALQREVPTWMRRFQAAKDEAALVKNKDEDGLLKSITGHLVSFVGEVTTTITTAITTGLSELATRFDARFDRIEALIEAPSQKPEPVQAAFVPVVEAKLPRSTTSDGKAKTDWNGKEGVGYTLLELQDKMENYHRSPGSTSVTLTAAQIDEWVRAMGMHRWPWSQVHPKRGKIFDLDVLNEVRRHWPAKVNGADTAFTDP
jgi:hypothetical protein